MTSLAGHKNSMLWLVSVAEQTVFYQGPNTEDMFLNQTICCWFSKELSNDSMRWSF